ncbi:MAG: hypothetical protein ABWX84_13750 [Nocardioides sp.]
MKGFFNNPWVVGGAAAVFVLLGIFEISTGDVLGGALSLACAAFLGVSLLGRRSRD